MDTTTSPDRADLLAAFAAAWAQGLDAQDARTPDEAAAAAGHDGDAAETWIAQHYPAPIVEPAAA